MPCCRRGVVCRARGSDIAVAGDEDAVEMPSESRGLGRLARNMRGVVMEAGGGRRRKKEVERKRNWRESKRGERKKGVGLRKDYEGGCVPKRKEKKR